MKLKQKISKLLIEYKVLKKELSNLGYQNEIIKKIKNKKIYEGDDSNK